MQLMQQYVMINGRLQPALKYLKQIPMFNRYKIDNAGMEDYQEIVTYPTLRGDLKMKNRHQGVNFDDRIAATEVSNMLVNCLEKMFSTLITGR